LWFSEQESSLHLDSLSSAGVYTLCEADKQCIEYSATSSIDKILVLPPPPPSSSSSSHHHSLSFLSPMEVQFSRTALAAILAEKLAELRQRREREESEGTSTLFAQSSSSSSSSASMSSSPSSSSSTALVHNPYESKDTQAAASQVAAHLSHVNAQLATHATPAAALLLAFELDKHKLQPSLSQRFKSLADELLFEAFAHSHGNAIGTHHANGQYIFSMYAANLYSD
jgi:hypothetical protein